MFRYKTIDAQVAGEPVRLVVEGAPSVKGQTMADKLAWLRKHGEPLRKMLMLEPRGHAAMHGALLTEPALPKAHAGVLFMNAGGFPALSGEAVIAAVAIAIEQRIIHVDSDDLYIDTPVGVLTAHPNRVETSGEIRVDTVTLTGLTGFVQAAGVPVPFGTRIVPVDVAFGGEFYAITDSEAVGIPVDLDHAPELIRAAARLRPAVDAALRGGQPALAPLNGVIFTTAARDGGHLRIATILDGGVVKRSPGVTGTVAVAAVLDAMGILDDGSDFITEGLVGTMLSGRVLQRQTVAERAIILPRIDGPVSITGYHEFVG